MGPNSEFAKRNGFAKACKPNAAGVTECSAEEAASENQDPNIPKPAAVDHRLKDRPLSCGQKCSHPQDCGGSDDDCLCTWDQRDQANQARADNAWPGRFPDVASWGVFACLSAVNMQCRGRCLLNADGSAADRNDSGVIPHPASTYTLAPPVVCPCNCTYASEGCCLSSTGIVFERPEQRVNTVIQGPEGKCCDHVTGKWIVNQGVVRDSDNAAGSDPECPTQPTEGNGGTGTINT